MRFLLTVGMTAACRVYERGRGYKAGCAGLVAPTPLLQTNKMRVTQSEAKGLILINTLASDHSFTPKPPNTYTGRIRSLANIFYRSTVLGVCDFKPIMIYLFGCSELVDCLKHAWNIIQCW
jgi:hypothetical protein